MPLSATKNRQAHLESAAQEYQRQGYEVVLAPPRDTLPSFLADCDIPLIARREGLNVVVVVRTPQGRTQPGCLQALAETLERHPGWRLDVVAFPLSKTRSTRWLAPPLNKVQIRAQLTQVEMLIQAGCLEGALLLGWAALEATLRHLASQEKLSLSTMSPERLIKTLVYQGVIAPNHYETLQEALTLRNLLTEGSQTPPLRIALLQTLTHITRSLLD